jgi:pyruvate dehydrogenase E2 component (dihydrolipoamide acetyltransferase)
VNGHSDFCFLLSAFCFLLFVFSLDPIPMSIDITMPRLSDTMEAGTIIKWNVAEGDAVSAGDAIADIETDKATMEMQAFDDGTVAVLVVDEGRTVDVGTVIAVLAEEGEDPQAVTAAAAGGADVEARAPAGDTAVIPPATARPATAVIAEPAGQRRDGRIRVSPVARQLADEHGVDLRSLQGSGPSGRVIKRDVLQAIETHRETAAAVAPSARRPDEEIEAPPAAPEAPSIPVTPLVAVQEPASGLRGQIVPRSSMRQTIARRLVESSTTIPHYQVSVTIDMEPVLNLRRSLNEQLDGQGVKLSVNDFLVRACALAMHRHPYFNASWDGDSIRIHGEVNVGVAIALPPERGGGLVVATIRHADAMSLRMISTETRQLAEKARTRGLSVEEMAGSTFTISNLGMFGVDHFTAIINPPNSAIMAVGAAQERPVVRRGELTVGHEMTVTLSLDHRVIDGAMAAQYMGTVREMIERPAVLLI